MKENFLFLTAVSDYEVELVCQRLKKAKIEYVVKDSPVNVYQRQYGATSLLGKEILVMAPQLTEAKELLNIENKNFSLGKWKISMMGKIIISLTLITLFLALTYFFIQLIIQNQY